MIEALFLRHPRSVGETYGQHFVVAVEFGMRLFSAAIACLVHAAIPAMFERTASQMVSRIYADMTESRRQRIENGYGPDYQI